MSRTSNTQQLNIDASIGIDLLFVLLAELGDLPSLELSIGNVDVFSGNVDVVEKVEVHVVVV
jgi:hypothetical protein